jgi:zinc-binding in reverse transcriptase
LWLALHNRILSRDNLLRRGWQGSASCVFCSHNESVDHLFFTCPLAHSIWQLLFQLFPQGQLFPTNSLFDFWQTCIKLPLLDLLHWGRLLAAFLWVIWTTRNSSIFCTTVSHSATSLLFSILHLYAFWTGHSVSGLVGGSSGMLLPPVGTGSTGFPAASRVPVRGPARGDAAVESHSDEDLFD